MTVTTESGLRLIIPAHHPVYTPLGDYHAGQEIDPVTVEVDSDRAATLRRGKHIIVDNRVEVVALVATA